MPRLLIEIGHPGHVHFFKDPIRILKNHDWSIMIHARNKAECFELLESENLDFFPGLRHQSTVKNILNIPKFVGDIYRLSKRFSVDIMAGVGGCHAALTSRLNNIPFVSYTDTEHAREQALLYVPHCSSIHTPNAFKLDFGKKHHRYPGYHELSYLHPNQFTPNREKIEESGLLENGPPIVMRIVGFTASHDFAIKQIRWKTEFIRKYHKDYRIIISSELPLPRNLQPFNNPLPANELHNLLAFTRMYIGSGATTASEAAILGSPVVYTNPLTLGYLDEMERKYGLVYNRKSLQGILSSCEKILSEPKQTYIERSKKLVNESCDVAQYVADTIEKEIEGS